MNDRLARLIVWAALGLLIWGAILSITGGFAFRVVNIHVASRDPVRPLVLFALLLTVAYAVSGRRRVDDELNRVVGFCRSAAMPVAIIASVAACGVGLRWGTFAASGVDAYGYVSEGVLWTHGSLRIEQPFVARIPWPGADWAFAPMGYRPAVDGYAIVPSYAPGLPLLMAFGELAGGACGPYYVVPVLGGLCVWFCYLLGRRAASAAVGACAAVLFACSPPFLFHLVTPMSDVPVAALWSGALYLALGAGPSTPLGAGAARSASAGVFAALAILVRPNLAPLAGVIAVFVAWPERSTGGHPRLTQALWFAAALVPALAAIAIINTRLYGSPVMSGYGDLAPAYSVAHIAENARRYTTWILQTHTPFVGLAAVGLLAPMWTCWSTIAPRTSALLLVFSIGIAASYLPYSVFDDWSYLRFFLPVMPVLLVSAASSLLLALRFVPIAARIVAFVALATFLVSHEVRFAIHAGLTRLQPNERRYVAVARFIEAATPPNAVFVALQHAGSVRHYAGRLTVRFDRISTGLEEALAALEHAGWRPFLLLEDWEEPQFTRQFGSSSEIGRLGWRPYARLAEPGGVNIYDPTQVHDVKHEPVAIPPPGACDCRHW